MGINGIDVKQLNPTQQEYNQLFDITHDKTAFYIHTTPLLHYLNVQTPFKNSIIIDEKDAEMMKRMSGSVVSGLI